MMTRKAAWTTLVLLAAGFGGSGVRAADLDVVAPHRRPLPVRAVLVPPCDKAWRETLLDCRPRIAVPITSDEVFVRNAVSTVKSPLARPYLPFFAGW